MSKERGYCISCNQEMTCIDDDPNGALNSTCACCIAEEAHDYDAEPSAIFSRSGERIDDVPCVHVMPTKLKEILKNIDQQPQRQDASNDQLADLVTFANRLGLYDASDTIKELIKEH